jgi:hypothetical protein
MRAKPVARMTLRLPGARYRTLLLQLAMTIPLTWACGEPRVVLGPADGRELPPADTGRVKVGDIAPDFSLQSYDDGVVTLSDYRGQKNVVLVFYRGHW